MRWLTLKTVMVPILVPMMARAFYNLLIPITAIFVLQCNSLWPCLRMLVLTAKKVHGTFPCAGLASNSHKRWRSSRAVVSLIMVVLLCCGVARSWQCCDIQGSAFVLARRMHFIWICGMGDAIYYATRGPIATTLKHNG
ncbi:hypothetical protein D3C77_621780 [compost metagenome]